jgi:D-threo-aldose 1-dehydrogenase
MKISRTRKLHRVDLEVTEISYGGAPIGNRFTVMPEATAQALLTDAWNSGVRYFDTAPMYGNGLSEHRMGHFLLGHERNDYVLSTKVGRTLIPAPRGSFDSGPWFNPPPMRADFDYSFDAAYRQVHTSLHRMLTDRIDILYLHDVDPFIHGDDYPARLQESLDGAIPAMVRMREEGLISAVGAGVNESGALLSLVQQADLDCLLVAGRYTLLDHANARGFMDLCQQRGISVVAGGVFNTGILATGTTKAGRFNYGDAPAEVREQVDRLDAVCHEFGVSLPAAAIAFAGAHPAVVSVCLGATTIAQQTANARAAEEVIPTEFWAALHERGLIEDWAPTP